MIVSKQRILAVYTATYAPNKAPHQRVSETANRLE
jgi:hypothetical protein